MTKVKKAKISQLIKQANTGAKKIQKFEQPRDLQLAPLPQIVDAPSELVRHLLVAPPVPLLRVDDSVFYFSNHLYHLALDPFLRLLFLRALEDGHLIGELGISIEC